MKKLWRLLPGAVLFQYGVILGFSHLFMEDWASESPGRPDLLDRGTFFVGAMLPFVTAAAALVFALFSYIALPRPLRSILGSLGASAGGAIIALGMAIVTWGPLATPLPQPWTAVPGAVVAIAGVIACILLRRPTARPGGGSPKGESPP